MERQAEFLPLAARFFRDGDRLPAEQFIPVGLLDREDARLSRLEGKVDIAQLSLVLHIWGWDGQVEACKRVVELLRPEKGSMIVGQSLGHVDGEEAAGRSGHTIFKHNTETFSEMWREIGRATSTEWHVQASLEGGVDAAEPGGRWWYGPGTRRLTFIVQRL